MNRLLGRLFLPLIGSLLAACSLGTEPVRQAASVPPSASARPVAVDDAVKISGRLLFVQDGNLYLHQGTATRQLTRDGKSRSPRWSPDGSRIAYVEREESFADIFVLDAQGGVPTQVTFNGSRSPNRSIDLVHEVVWAADPTWSPDGTELAFLSQLAPPQANPPLEYPLAIYRYDLSLVGKRQPTNDDLLIQNDAADLQRPAWSRDGQIAYVTLPRDNRPKQIMLYDLNTGESTPFPGVPQNSYDPAWSPDGGWLAFTATLDGQTDVWVVPAPGRSAAPARLTHIGRARSPVWSPDGSQIAYVQVSDAGADLMVLPLQTQNGTISAGKATALTQRGQIDANSGLSWGR